MTGDSPTKVCPTCRLPRTADQFYETSTECRSCKRLRSQQNRNALAEKVALADRLLDVLERLAAQGWRPETALSAKVRGPAGDATAPGPLTEPQEVRP